MFTCNICSFLILTSATDVTYVYCGHCLLSGSETLEVLEKRPVAIFRWKGERDRERERESLLSLGHLVLESTCGWTSDTDSHCPEYSDLSVAAKLHILDFNLSSSSISIPLI